MPHPPPSATQPQPSWRTHLALALLVALALLGIIRGILFYQPEVLLRAYSQQQDPPLDNPERIARSLRCLDGLLPTDQVLGFSSELSGAARLEQLRQVQYAVAPSLITDRIDQRLVVAVFSHPLETLPPQLRNHQVVQDCENGVYLLRAPLLP